MVNKRQPNALLVLKSLRRERTSSHPHLEPVADNCKVKFDTVLLKKKKKSQISG
jgi:hypothetical protein